MSKKKKNHTANHIASTFILSKRHLKKIYQLNLARIGLLRYLCDSIDMISKSRKSLSTKLYQSQISQYCCCDLKTVRLNMKILIKKKLIKYDEEKHTYTLGKALLTWGETPYAVDVGRNSLSGRCGEKLPTSNSSNFTNTNSRSTNFKKQKAPVASVDSQSTTYTPNTFVKKTSTIASNTLSEIKLNLKKKGARNGISN